MNFLYQYLVYYFNTCTVHPLLYVIITNKYAINIIKVYITVMYNLYSYVFRHFRIIIGEFTSAPRLGTQAFQFAALENTIS
jgi:hypothetical protein